MVCMARTMACHSISFSFLVLYSHFNVDMMVRQRGWKVTSREAFHRRIWRTFCRIRIWRMVCAADIDDVMRFFLAGRGVVGMLAVSLCILLFLPELLGALIAFDTANRIQHADALDVRAQVIRLYRH